MFELTLSKYDSRYWENEPLEPPVWLAIRTWDALLERHVFFKLCPLDKTEYDLNNGRLKLYEPKAEIINPIKVCLSCNQFGQLIDWVDENIKSPWTINIQEIYSLPNIISIFSFKDKDEAAFFKLSWGQ